MKMILLDGAELTSMDEVHDLFAEKLEFPDYYGRNLDALHDCLTDVQDEVFVCVDHPQKLTEKLGDKGAALLTLLENAETENSGIECMFSAE